MILLVYSLFRRFISHSSSILVGTQYTMATIQPRGAPIFREGTGEDKKEGARMAVFMGAIAVSDLVKSTLGPKGMDKILQSMDDQGHIEVSNDGATILKSLYISNPASKILVEISKSQDDEVGDGTTSVVVLAGELLREADKLVNQLKIHPQIIAEGWREASEVALAALEKSAMQDRDDEEKFKQSLLQIARTTLSSKILGQSGYRDFFAELAVSAVLRLKGSTDLNMIAILKKVGGSIENSFLDSGFLLEKKIGVGQPKRIEKAKILVANTAMDTDKIKIFGSTVVAESPEQVAAIEAAERKRMLQKCENIVNHGINCFINRQLIYNLPEQYFADHGVMAIEHADFEGVERLALVTGADIVSTFNSPDKVKLGYCDLIEEVMIGEDKVIHFSGVARGEACTVVLRGPTEHFLNEAERALHDALCVLSQTMATNKDSRTVWGGGCAESIMASAVHQLSLKTSGKKALAIEAYARALMALPGTLAENGGYDSADLVTKLRAEHTKSTEVGEGCSVGLNLDEGELDDMSVLGIREPIIVKRQIVLSASEAAEMILRIDEVVRAPPRQREDDPRYGH